MLASRHGTGLAGPKAGNDAGSNSLTVKVYSLIRERCYDDAIAELQFQLGEHPRSRACLSLLGYCQRCLQDFDAAVTTYEKLWLMYPSEHEYGIQYAQCLFKLGQFAEASKVCSRIERSLSESDESSRQQLLLVQAALAYEQRQYVTSLAEMSEETLLSLNTTQRAQAYCMMGCFAFQQNEFVKARQCFAASLQLVGFQPSIAYNAALACFYTKEHSNAMQHLENIVTRGIVEHPELAVSAHKEKEQAHSVGNSAALKETALVEALNLKAAIEWQNRNTEGAAQALCALPPRADYELDPVTLHNTAIVEGEGENPQVALQKLTFLLQADVFPPQTLTNLVLLLIRLDKISTAADTLADNAHLISSIDSSKATTDFLRALCLSPTAPAEAFQQLDTQAQKHIEKLRALSKEIQSARQRQNVHPETIRAALGRYQEALEAYVPILMAQARIYWERNHFEMVEKLLQKSQEFCAEHSVWQLNLAHCFFMQEDKFKEAIRFYEPTVRSAHRLLDVPAIVVANLCVSYILMSQNEEAEAIMHQLEKEEEEAASMRKLQSTSSTVSHEYHLCIVNLVIGTLYCAKGNFEFGIQRVLRSLTPLHEKLNTDTWFYAKTCLMALAAQLAKQMTIVSDTQLSEIVQFLSQVQLEGGDVLATLDTGTASENADGTDSKRTVALEARILQSLFLQANNA
ncbi:MAG: hypothetical protein MHM6MM_003251 [Cercozoa sp. M6MM]